MNHPPPAHYINSIRHMLGLSPRPAEEIATEAGVPREEAYHCLAWLYDRKEARIARDNRGQVDGWVQGINA